MRVTMLLWANWNVRSDMPESHDAILSSFGCNSAHIQSPKSPSILTARIVSQSAKQGHTLSEGRTAMPCEHRSATTGRPSLSSEVDETSSYGCLQMLPAFYSMPRPQIWMLRGYPHHRPIGSRSKQVRYWRSSVAGLESGRGRRFSRSVWS